MIRIRKSENRGHADVGWLQTHHTFSFGSYQDPEHVSFRSLCVINEDIVSPNSGFGTHPHRNMEILTYVLSGQLRHEDSMGHGSLLEPRQIQRMTAGSGITHSELNPHETESTHLYQIWLYPDQQNLSPSYQQLTLDRNQQRNCLRLIASPEESDGSVLIHQDVRVYLADLESGKRVGHSIAPGRHAWLQVLSGSVSISGIDMKAGDGAAVSDESKIDVLGKESSEVMLFDLG